MGPPSFRGHFFRAGFARAVPIFFRAGFARAGSQKPGPCRVGPSLKQGKLTYMLHT